MVGFVFSLPCAASAATGLPEENAESSTIAAGGVGSRSREFVVVVVVAVVVGVAVGVSILCESAEKPLTGMADFMLGHQPDFFPLLGVLSLSEGCAFQNRNEATSHETDRIPHREGREEWQNNTRVVVGQFGEHERGQQNQETKRGAQNNGQVIE